SGNNRALQFHDGARFRGVIQQLDVRYWGWGWGQIVVPDREGDVWIGTGDALLRYRNARTFAELTSRVPSRYTPPDGLGGNDIFRVWEDSRGDLWIGHFGPVTLTRFDRASGRFVSMPPRDGIPQRAPTAFAEDRQGNVWIGWYDGGVTRMTRDGH